MSKPWPTLTSDEEAERFVAEADLSEYDFSIGYRARLVRRNRVNPVRLELSDDDLNQAIEAARAEKQPLGVYLSQVLHDFLNRKAA